MDGTFDPLDLDWSRHGLHRDDREFAEGGIFLAEAATRLGAAMIEYWHGSEGALLADGERSRLVDLPPAHLAFGPDGSPIRKVHTTYGPLVRRVISPAAFADMELRASDPDRWKAEHVRDPIDGEPIPANLLRARSGKDADDPISRDNWDCAYVDGLIEHGLRTFAIGKMKAIARAFAELAQAGTITMLSRPLREGRTQRLDRPIWMSGAEQRMRRLASCAYCELHPDDASAAPDHLLFVADEGFGPAIAEYAAEHRITVEELAHSVWPNPEATQLAASRPSPNARLILPYIVHLLSTKERSNWRTKDLAHVISATFGGEALEHVATVRELLIANHPQFVFLTSSGQPPPRGRPSIEGWPIAHPYGTPEFDQLLERLRDR